MAGCPGMMAVLLQLPKVDSMEEPKINTAIPKRRYQVGPFSAVVLGDIDSGDEHDYQYILAMVEEGKDQPGFYVLAERATGEDAKRGRYRMRILAPWGTEVLGCSDRWAGVDNFVGDALSITMAKLAITDESVIRLM